MMISKSLLPFRIALVVFAILLAAPLPAYAGRITLNWMPKLAFSESGTDVAMRGTIEISNSGDEKTLEVSPGFRLGSWEWAGEPKEIDAAGKETWAIDLVIPRAMLQCTNDSACSGVSLPDKGYFPLILRVTYHDLNRYQFSALEILTAAIGTIDPNVAAAVRVQTVVPAISVDGDGSEFSGNLELNNVSDASRKAAVSILSASEILVESPAGKVEISPHSIARKSFSVKNFSGLIGNSYRVYGLVQWENQGVRVFSQISTMFKLAEPDKSAMLLGLIWALAGFSAALVVGTAYLVLRRKTAAA